MSTQTYLNKVKTVARLVKEADFILIGAGAGLSASAGLNYMDVELFKKWFPVLAERGFHTIWEAVTTYWVPNDDNRRAFWAYWANHIQKIRYDAPPGNVYLNLHELMDGKKHFVITTNVDGQFVKSGFNQDLIFGPQGDYNCFQCETPCKNVVYDNQVYVQQMLAHMNNDNFQIEEADIPHCPNCGKYMERNLRIDHRFVEAPYMAKQEKYADFVNNSSDGKLVLLELGVGFNTPGIIRWPFERIAIQHPNATLVRINLRDSRVSQELGQKVICIEQDISPAIQDILEDKKLK